MSDDERTIQVLLDQHLQLCRQYAALEAENEALKAELEALARRCDTTPLGTGDITVVGTDPVERHEADRPACCQGDAAE